ncbi:hypothetical protein ACLK2H_23060 [Escherichia coli]
MGEHHDHIEHKIEI